MELWDLGLLGLQLLLYFVVMVMLFGMRHRYGIGIFFCALGAMHFLETYLAATFYVAAPWGVVVSPGSTVLFAGKLVLLLLVYIREDAIAVRQPIYGLFVGNMLTIALIGLLRSNNVLPSAGPSPDFLFMDQMGVLMIWGTLLLLADCILIILIYERLGRLLGANITLRVAVSGVIVLSFDQFAFWPVLHAATGVPIATLFGGWIAKSAVAVVCALLAGIYLRYVERRMLDGFNHPRLADVFDALTYRQRYEKLLEHAGRDGLTGVADRGRMEGEAEGFVVQAMERGETVSVFLIDIDDFKGVNDRGGHLVGDTVLRGLADMLRGNLRDHDKVYRFGGDEFVVATAGLSAAASIMLAERLRRLIGELPIAGLTEPLSVCIGVANSPDDGNSFLSLLSVADKRLYAAKDTGRNRVIGGRETPERDPTGMLGQT